MTRHSSSPPPPKGEQAAIEQAATSMQPGEEWQLRLYVAGMTPAASRALSNLRALCEAHLERRFSLTVVDLLEHPESAEADQILAVPTLVRQSPLPIRKVIGDLSDTASALRGLGLFIAS